LGTGQATPWAGFFPSHEKVQQPEMVRARSAANRPSAGRQTGLRSAIAKKLSQVEVLTRSRARTAARRVQSISSFRYAFTSF
jgi:hypothetical protein